MHVREYVPSDYKTIETWMKGYSSETAVPELWLPDTGFIIDDLSCVFIYKTNSNIAYIEVLTGNPKAEKETKNIAINKVFEHAVAFAKEIGYKFVFAFVEKEYVENRLITLGFHDTGLNIKMMIRGI